MTEPKLELFRTAITRAFPKLAASTFRLVTTGWHSTAVDADDRLIFKFPRHEAAETALLKEAALLAVIRPSVSMTVPESVIHNGPPLFSRHTKLKGEHLLTAEYVELPEDARQRLGRSGALLCRVPSARHRPDDRGRCWADRSLADAGCDPREGVARTAAGASRSCGGSVAAFERLPADPYGATFGFFDGHGWNMAFGHARSQLNGVYDFADSGVGPLHQEFITLASFHQILPNVSSPHTKR